VFTILGIQTLHLINIKGVSLHCKCLINIFFRKKPIHVESHGVRQFRLDQERPKAHRVGQFVHKRISTFYQWCGTVMFCCGSGYCSDFEKVLVSVPAPFPVPVPIRIQTIFSSFSKTNKLHQILPFQCQKQLISRKLASHFGFFDFVN
jgi:hypothetical protein